MKKKSNSDGIELQLLVKQATENAWVVVDSESISLVASEHSNSDSLAIDEGSLVLVDLDENGQILKLENAKNWIVTLLQKISAMSSSATDEFCLEEEEARIEQWRQELTSQSQDITRRNLEIETRREQIQELETSLKKEKEELEQAGTGLEQQKTELEQTKAELEQAQTELEQTKAELEQTKAELESRLKELKELE